MSQLHTPAPAIPAARWRDTASTYRYVDDAAAVDDADGRAQRLAQ
jgi:hypothetical protein